MYWPVDFFTSTRTHGLVLSLTKWSALFGLEAPEGDKNHAILGCITIHMYLSPQQQLHVKYNNNHLLFSESITSFQLHLKLCVN